MPGLRSGQMELPLQIGSGDVDVAHRHLGIDVPEQLHERRQTYPRAYHLTGICVPELVRNDVGADTDCSDNIGKVRTELLDEVYDKAVYPSRSRSQPGLAGVGRRLATRRGATPGQLPLADQPFPIRLARLC